MTFIKSPLEWSLIEFSNSLYHCSRKLHFAYILNIVQSRFWTIVWGNCQPVSLKDPNIVVWRFATINNWVVRVNNVDQGKEVLCYRCEFYINEYTCNTIQKLCFCLHAETLSVSEGIAFWPQSAQTRAMPLNPAHGCHELNFLSLPWL